MPPRTIGSLIRNTNRNNTQIGNIIANKLQKIQQQLGQQQPGQPPIHLQLQAIQQQLGQQQPGQPPIHMQLQTIQQQLGQQQPGQPPIHMQLQTIQQQLQAIQQQLGQQQPGQQQPGQPPIQQGQVHLAPLTPNDTREMINKGFAQNDLESCDYFELQSYKYIKSYLTGFRFAQIRIFFEGLIDYINQQPNQNHIPLSSYNDKRNLKNYLRYLDVIWCQIENHLIHPPQLMTNEYQNNYDNAKDKLIV